MNLNDASNLGNLQDVIFNIQIFGLLMQILFPIVVVLVGIEFFKAIQKAFNKKIKRDEIKRQQQKEVEKQQKKVNLTRQRQKQRINRLYKDDEFLMRQLEGTHEPFDKSAYRDLDLTFDKKGKAIR